MTRAINLLAALGLACASCSTRTSSQEPAPLSPAAGGPGASKATAIEVCNPPGERAFLENLVCADGTHPTYRRVGNVGTRTDFPKNLSREEVQKLEMNLLLRRGQPLAPGEPDYHIVDQYEVACGATTRVLYMDMYHCDAAKPPFATSSAPGNTPPAPPAQSRLVCELFRPANAASAPPSEPLRVSFDENGTISLGLLGPANGKVTEQAVLVQIRGPMWIKIDRRTMAMSTVIVSDDRTSIELAGAGQCHEAGPGRRDAR